MNRYTKRTKAAEAAEYIEEAAMCAALLFALWVSIAAFWPA